MFLLKCDCMCRRFQNTTLSILPLKRLLQGLLWNISDLQEAMNHISPRLIYKTVQRSWNPFDPFSNHNSVPVPRTNCHLDYDEVCHSQASESREFIICYAPHTSCLSLGSDCSQFFTKAIRSAHTEHLLWARHHNNSLLVSNASLNPIHLPHCSHNVLSCL